MKPFYPEEKRPSGVGGLTARSLGYLNSGIPDLSDCLVNRPRPFRLVIWEPLLTKAPSPAIVRPYCCYSNTVIFYDADYRLQLWGRPWRDAAGVLFPQRRGFEEFDRVETRMTWDMQVEFEGDMFVIGGGCVVWASRGLGGADFPRWWMRRVARRKG